MEANGPGTRVTYVHTDYNKHNEGMILGYLKHLRELISQQLMTRHLIVMSTTPQTVVMHQTHGKMKVFEALIFILLLLCFAPPLVFYLH